MSNKLDWNNAESLREYIKLVNELGPPSVKSTKANGIAIWIKEDLSRKIFYGSSNCFDEIMLRDEAIEHHNPVPHFDCLYVSIKVPIPKNKLALIDSVSLATYDRMKNYLTVRCSNIKSCILILYVITKLILGEIKEKEALNYHKMLVNDIQNPNLIIQIYGDLVNNKMTLESMIKPDDINYAKNLLGGSKKTKPKKASKKPTKTKSKTKK
jgi:hypothetical protein